MSRTKPSEERVRSIFKRRRCLNITAVGIVLRQLLFLRTFRYRCTSNRNVNKRVRRRGAVMAGPFFSLGGGRASKGRFLSCTLAGRSRWTANLRDWPRTKNRPPPHVHPFEDEVFWVMEGEMTVEVGGKTVVLGPGA